jgi:hypothetical protein
VLICTRGKSLRRALNANAEAVGLFYSELRYIAGDSYSLLEEVMRRDVRSVRAGLEQRLILRKVLSRTQEVTDNEA